jgi:hypothetical protein
MKLIFPGLVRLREAEYRVAVQLSRLGSYNKEAKVAFEKWMDKLEKDYPSNRFTDALMMDKSDSIRDYDDISDDPE